ncbi:3-hydroxyacyl-ACP dehydratase FabZ family protein [Streptomyces sp. cmx-4-9]|uniref:3-hydroxyacyl-ACP dehydratase FabZ family protein n=1 Tax=Streptomyces sp. cmx-4-9 TaxID=2790941 RepID=UPI0039817480
MTPVHHNSPVRAELRALRPARAAGGDGDLQSGAEAVIGAGEPVFAGHYPQFPIFPGVCVVECVHLAARATAPAAGLTLAALESARFVGAVFPGDTLTVALHWKAREDGWSASGEAATSRGTAAKVRLRYRAGGDG